jgi:hypothetical protein
MNFQHSTTGADKVSRTISLLPTNLMQPGQTHAKFCWISYGRTKAEPHLETNMYIFFQLSVRCQSRLNFGNKSHHKWGLGLFKLISNTLSTGTLSTPQLEQTKSLKAEVCFLQTKCNRVKRMQSFRGFHMVEPTQNDTVNMILLLLSILPTNRARAPKC